MSTFPGILYVEDDMQNRMVMEILLIEDLGLENVAIFEDSSDFISRVEELPFTPDIILLDIHVEPIDGFTMLAQLREHPAYSELPVVAVTASVMNEEVARLKSSGFNGAVAKPIPLENFAEVLERILDGQRIWHIV